LTEKKATIPVEIIGKETTELAAQLEHHEDMVNQFLAAKKLISEGQTWRDASEKVISRIKADPVAFLKTVSDWMEGQQ
jgi:hypothetical protein